MKIFSKQNVLEAALDRIRYLFDEFANIVVGFSGGKDSTIVFHLAMQVAREKGRLPLKVLWIDQEAEWQGTVDFCQSIMEHPDVEPWWFQMPMVITNNASSFDRYSHCWNEEDRGKWIHPKHPLSIKENTYGTERFHGLFEAIFKKEFHDQKSCYLAGVRAEESPKRAMVLTDNITYKAITWGKKLNADLGHYTFYPIYDWSYTDVWKAINEFGWEYCNVYDKMYQHGVKIVDMRISNVHHETAIQSLMLIQELEPETWVRVAGRIEGANTIKHLKSNSFKCPKDLPEMFSDWEEYGIHLATHIVQKDKDRADLLARVAKMKRVYVDEPIKTAFFKEVINTILSSDWDFTKLENFRLSPNAYSYSQFRKGKRKPQMLKSMKYYTPEMKQELLADLGKGITK